MSIRNTIKVAQVRAATEVAKNELGSYRGSLVRLNEVLESASHLEAILTLNGTEELLVLPVNSQNPVDTEDDLMDSVKSALKGFRPKSTEFGEYSAFRISTSNRKLPRTLQVYVGNMRFDLDIVRQDLDMDVFKNNSYNRGVRKKRETTREYLPKSEWYMPTIGAGFEFKIDKSNNNPKYPLLPLNKSIRPYFPGLSVPFNLIYLGEETKTHVACAGANKKMGELAGNYFSEGISRLFRTHPEVREAGIVQMRVIRPGKAYEITSVR